MGPAHDAPLLALSSLERGVLICDLASSEIVLSNPVAQLQLRSLGFDGHAIPHPLRVAIDSCLQPRAPAAIALDDHGARSYVSVRILAGSNVLVTLAAE